MWQPINTAPKNKTIDLWCNSLGRVPECIFSFSMDSWRTKICGSSFRVISEEPTHWMDIPKNPINNESIKQQDQIIDDINKRKLNVIGFVCANEHDKIQILSYDSNGLIKFLSRKVTNIEIYEKKGNTIKPMCNISHK